MLNHPAFCLFLLALIISVLSMPAKLFEAKKEVCAVELRDTIFVVLATDHSVKFSEFFQKSTFPERIFIGICDTSVEGIEVDDIRLQNNVRIFRLRKKVSVSEKRKHVWDATYMEEKHALLVPHDVVLAQDWDSILIEMQSKLHEKSIITSACNPLNLLGETKPYFFTASSITGASLSLAKKRVFESPDKCVPSLFWSPEFSFSLSHAFKASHFIPTSRKLDVSLHSISLWTNGYSFVVPTSMPAWIPNPSIDFEKNSVPSRLQIGKIRSLYEYETFCGVQFKLSILSRRAQAGLSPNASVNECTVKYGTVAASKRMLYVFSETSK